MRERWSEFDQTPFVARCVADSSAWFKSMAKLLLHGGTVSKTPAHGLAWPIWVFERGMLYTIAYRYGLLYPITSAGKQVPHGGLQGFCCLRIWRLRDQICTTSGPRVNCVRQVDLMNGSSSTVWVGRQIWKPHKDAIPVKVGYSMFFFFSCMILKPRAEWCKSLWALSTSPPWKHCTFLWWSCP